MDIATRLDTAMKAAKIPSQSALSRASGVPQPTINRILQGKGKSGPETETLRKLAAAVNVTVEHLRDGASSLSRPLRDAGHAEMVGEPAQDSDQIEIEGAIRLAMIFRDIDANRRVRLLRYATTMLTEFKNEAQATRKDDRKATA